MNWKTFLWDFMNLKLFSDKSRFGYFFRVVPSDYYQVESAPNINEADLNSHCSPKWWLTWFFNLATIMFLQFILKVIVAIKLKCHSVSTNLPQTALSTPIWGKVESEVNKTCACVDRSDYFNLLSSARVESLTKVSESSQVMQK